MVNFMLCGFLEPQFLKKIVISALPPSRLAWAYTFIMVKKILKIYFDVNMIFHLNESWFFILEK